MSKGYILSDMAKDDLQEIWWYGAGFGGEHRGDAAVDRIYTTLELLAEHPLMGKGRDWLDPDQLAFPSGLYIIVYRIVGDDIEVSRVTGADQDLKRHH